MKRWGLLLVLLVFPASAHAVTLLRPNGVVAEPYQRWMAGLREPTVAGVVVLHTYSRCPASSPTVVACASPGPGQPAIWMRFRDRGTLLHELGHLFAFSVGEPSTERFADSYAFCARPLHSELQPVATEWWYPTAWALLRECDRMRALGGWVMTPYEVSRPG